MHAVRTYLELRRPAGWTDAAADGATDAALDVRRAARPTPAEYRALYAAVGRDYHWRDRDGWSDARLGQHLDDPRVSLWVLREDGATAGYFELVQQASPAPPGAPDAVGCEVELLYFGLVPGFHGRGLGRRLLERAIAEAWRLGAERLVLNTCTLDHPAALPNYLARGFRVVREETYEASVPGDTEPLATPE